MPQPKVDLLRALLPDPGTDVAQLFRDEDWFASTAEAVAELLDPDVESVPEWRGAGTTYLGIDGFREITAEFVSLPAGPMPRPTVALRAKRNSRPECSLGPAPSSSSTLAPTPRPPALLQNGATPSRRPGWHGSFGER